MSLLVSVVLATVLVHPLAAKSEVVVEPPAWTGVGLLTVGALGVAAGLGTKLAGSVWGASSA